MTRALEEAAVLQDMLDHNDFYHIDRKVEEVAKGFDLLALGLDRDVTALSGGQRTRIFPGLWLTLKSM